MLKWDSSDCFEKPFRSPCCHQLANRSSATRRSSRVTRPFGAGTPRISGSSCIARDTGFVKTQLLWCSNETSSDGHREPTLLAVLPATNCHPPFSHQASLVPQRYSASSTNTPLWCWHSADLRSFRVQPGLLVSSDAAVPLCFVDGGICPGHQAIRPSATGELSVSFRQTAIATNTGLLRCWHSADLRLSSPDFIWISQACRVSDKIKGRPLLWSGSASLSAVFVLAGPCPSSPLERATHPTSDTNVTSCGRRALLRRRPKDDEGTQLGREWIRTFIECETRGYIGVVDSRIRHIRGLPDLAVAQCRNDPKPRGSARHESAQLRNTTINTKRQTWFRNNKINDWEDDRLQHQTTNNH